MRDRGTPTPATEAAQLSRPLLSGRRSREPYGRTGRPPRRPLHRRLTDRCAGGPRAGPRGPSPSPSLAAVSSTGVSLQARFPLPDPAIEPPDEGPRQPHGKVLGRGFAPIEQELLRLVMSAETPIGDREAKEPADGFVAADVGVVHEMEAVQHSPEPTEARVFRRVPPPFVRPVLDRV